MLKKISVARYLFSRLSQLGVSSVHGVPGDFFLKALDDLAPSGLKWIGNCNELNAGYAADGYARVKGLSALFTTFGVGEMSAYNALAGSFAEYAPVVHIVGSPARKLQRERRMVHHTLGDGDFGVFRRMFRNVTVAQADLVNAAEIPEQIDEVLGEAVKQSRPVYLSLPSDIVPVPVAASRLKTPLASRGSANTSAHLEAFVDLISNKILSAQRPLILADGLCFPFDIVEEVNKLVEHSQIPAMCYPFGKGVIDEGFKNFYGVHTGRFGVVNNSAYVEQADLILLFGPLLSDNNSSGFTTIPDPARTIVFEKDKIELFKNATYQYNSKEALRAILDTLQHCIFDRERYITLQTPEITSLLSDDDGNVFDRGRPITQNSFWCRLDGYLRPHDLILLANGTPLPGARNFELPPHARILSSSIFLSVGHWLPAAQGVALAQRELGPSGRTILFEGDGSFQASTQELSTIIRHRLDVTIFLINNNGYTYERGIHGCDAEYNDIAQWRYLEAPRFFGASGKDSKYRVKTHRVDKWWDLDDMLADADFAKGKGLKLVEVVMDKEDLPGRMGEVLANAGRALDS
ncbi:MAG: hypothetical protein Q9160_002818 [Pyrenula sp. 1 TL-2023]